MAGAGGRPPLGETPQRVVERRQWPSARAGERPVATPPCREFTGIGRSKNGSVVRIKTDEVSGAANEIGAVDRTRIHEMPNAPFPVDDQVERRLDEIGYVSWR